MLNGRFIRICVALTLALFYSYLSNAYVNPNLDLPMIAVKSAAMLFNIVLLVAMACISAIKPSLFRFDGLLIAALSFDALGALCSIAPAASSEVVFFGCLLTQVAWMICIVTTGVSLVSFNEKTAAACIAIAFFAGAALRQIFIAMLPSSVGALIYLLAPALALALIAPDTKPALSQLAAGEPYYQASLTNPRSFLPFTHQLFICLFLFRIAPGFALNIGEGAGVYQNAPLALIPFALITVGILVKNRFARTDALFIWASLFVVAGFLLVPLTFAEARSITLTFLVVGAGIFEIFTWIVLSTIARNAPAESVAAFAWGIALVDAGTIAGSGVAYTVDTFQGDQNVLVLVSATIVFLFVCYAFVALRQFSFERSIENVGPAPLINEGGADCDDSSDAQDEATTTSAIDEVLGSIVKKCRLTEREADIAGLLAQGRNARYIQDLLCVSYNTVRSHIKHIYSKMDVHSQQELISAFESEMEQTAKAKQ